MRRLLPILVLLGACDSAERPAPPAPVAAPTLAHATQLDLGHELDDADRRGTWFEVRHKWQGQRLRWTVTRQRALCRSASACNVAAFPIQRPARYGWMPRLELTEGEYARIATACGEREQCELTIEGTLRDLDVSGERPTKLTFSDVRLVGDPSGAADRT